MEILDDGIMRAEIIQKGWIFLTWENNQIGHLPVSLVKDLRKIERVIREQGMTGWVCNSEKKHTDFHAILKRVGAQVYDEDNEVYFFKKEISHVQSN